jgi:hypothetical protein
MKSDAEIIDLLYKYGHFYSPEALSIAEVGPIDLPKLTLSDPVVKAAMRSMQGFMAPVLDHISLKLGNKIATHDGETTQAVRLMFDAPRCENPDVLHPSKHLKLSGTGSWPDPCQKAGVKFNVNPSGIPPALVSKWPAVLADVVKAYADVGLKLVEVSTVAEANIECYFGPFFGSTIGLSEFNNGSCDNQVTSKLSSSYVGYNRSLVAHEWGHCCNLQHTRGGIMNPVIMPDPQPFGWHGDDPSYPVLQRFFGGEPVTPPPAPTPTPTPGPKPIPGPTPSGFMRLPADIHDADGNVYQLILLPKAK